MIDPEVSENIIQYYIDNKSKYDYISNTIDRTYPRGLDTEVFSFKVLEMAFKEAVSLRDKEHVTSYIWNNPQIFKLAQYKNHKDYSHLRWTLDTEEDFELINKIYNLLYPSMNSKFKFTNILNIYRDYPELYEINREIIQKHI